MNEKIKEIEHGLLFSVFREAFFQCDLPADAVSFLTAHPHLLPNVVKVTLNNVVRKIDKNAEPTRIGSSVASAEEKLVLLGQIEDCFPYRDLTKETTVFLLENKQVFPFLIQRMIMRSGKKRFEATETDWTQYFPNLISPGLVATHCFMDQKFEAGDREVECKEVSLGRIVSGPEALETFLARGSKVANLRSAGKYLRNNPTASRSHTIVILGAQGRIRSNGPVYVPVLIWELRGVVSILPYRGSFSGECTFLLEAESGS